MDRVGLNSLGSLLPKAKNRTVNLASAFASASAEYIYQSHSLAHCMACVMSQ